MKIAGAVVLGLCLLAGLAAAADRMFAKQTSGWKGEGPRRYFVSSDTGQRVQGLYEINHKLYYFGEDGFVKTGWVRENGYVGYADENGTIQQGETKVDKKYYYFQPGTGQLYTGWVTLEDKTYCFDETGHPRTGRYQEDGQVWELDENGCVKEQMNGWRKTDDGLKYYDETGSLAQGWKQIDGKDYLFVDGTSQAGWAETESDLRYLDGNGNQMTGWCVIDGQPYAFDAEGQLKQGWDHSHGKDYYFESGVSQSGSFQEGRNRYELNGSGSVQPAKEAVPDEDLSQDAEGEAPEEGALKEEPALPETPAGSPKAPMTEEASPETDTAQEEAATETQPETEEEATT